MRAPCCVISIILSVSCLNLSGHQLVPTLDDETWTHHFPSTCSSPSSSRLVDALTKIQGPSSQASSSTITTDGISPSRRPSHAHHDTPVCALRMRSHHRPRRPANRPNRHPTHFVILSSSPPTTCGRILRPRLPRLNIYTLLRRSRNP